MPSVSVNGAELYYEVRGNGRSPRPDGWQTTSPEELASKRRAAGSPSA